MRFLVPATAALILAGCTTAPKPAAPVAPAPGPAPVQQSGDLIGMSVDELGERFGQPGFQVREGPGLKLQWTAPGCVLDAFLYPSQDGGGVARVTYVDARRPDGNPTDQAGCIAAIDAAG